MKRYVTTGICILFLLATCAASCEISLIQDGGSNNGGLSSEDVNTEDLQKAGSNTPQNLFSDFLDMIDEVEEMDNQDIDNLEDSEVLQLSSPIQGATVKTVFFDEEVLDNVASNLEQLTNLQNLSESEHSFISNRVEYVLDDATPDDNFLNFRSAEDMREVLKNWVSDSDTTTACSDLFNQQENIVILGEGENFNIANYACPEGTYFVLRGGTYSGQSVLSSKDGNRWIGLKNAVMDGEDSIYRAFSGGMNQNQFGFIEIRNYHLHGFFSEQKTSDILLRKMRFYNIAPDSSGQDYGAIKFDNTTGTSVRESRFENVASSVRFRFSSGPLEVIDNEAINSGRNFFQCGNCQGAGIRINENSMVREEAYGSVPLEDWINLFQSSGASDDWIQVHRNRARGHSLSGSGSFIMLGDDGGDYQEAVGNIGVNPGQVGIGIAGGHHIKVEANAMYSAAWDSSNVAYYSANYSPSCGNHQFTNSESAQPNRALWICGDPYNCHNPPTMNYAWSDGQCGISLEEIRENVEIDRSMTEDVWNEW